MSTSLVRAKETLVFQGPLGLTAPPEIAIECEAYTGSLGALVRCVLHQKVDLYDIPMLPICQAYAEYVMGSDSEDLEGATTALIAIAYLVERKAHRLLPMPEPEELEDELHVYDGPGILDFQTALKSLSLSFEDRQELFFRSAGEPNYEIPFEIKGVNGNDLARALEALLERATQQPEVFLSRPRRSLAEMMQVVARCLSQDQRSLVDLVEGEYTRVEALWWFLALLELIRLGTAGVSVLENGEVRFYLMAVAA